MRCCIHSCVQPEHTQTDAAAHCVNGGSSPFSLNLKTLKKTLKKKTLKALGEHVVAVGSMWTDGSAFCF